MLYLERVRRGSTRPTFSSEPEPEQKKNHFTNNLTMSYLERVWRDSTYPAFSLEPKPERQIVAPPPYTKKAPPPLSVAHNSRSAPPPMAIWCGSGAKAGAQPNTPLTRFTKNGINIYIFK